MSENLCRHLECQIQHAIQKTRVEAETQRSASPLTPDTSEHSVWTLIVLAYGQLKLGQILFFFTGLQDVDSRGLSASKGLQPGYKNFQLLQCPAGK